MKNTFINFAIIQPEGILSKLNYMHGIIAKNKLVKEWSDKTEKHIIARNMEQEHLVCTPNCDVTAF